MDHKGTSEFYLLNHKKQSIEQMVYAFFFIFFTKRSVGDGVFMLCDVVTAWCLVPAGGRKTEERWAGARDGIHPSAVTLSWGQPSTTTTTRGGIPFDVLLVL